MPALPGAIIACCCAGGGGGVPTCPTGTTVRDGDTLPIAWIATIPVTSPDQAGECEMCTDTAGDWCVDDGPYTVAEAESNHPIVVPGNPDWVWVKEIAEPFDCGLSTETVTLIVTLRNNAGSWEYSLYCWIGSSTHWAWAQVSISTPNESATLPFTGTVGSSCDPAGTEAALAPST